MISSTSASSRRWDRPESRTAWAIALALLIIVVLNAWVAVRLPLLLEGSHIQYVSDLERLARQVPHKERVRVLVIGNSHARRGLVPPYLAEAAGLPADAIFNLSVAASSPFLYRMMLPEYLALFPRVELVICTIEQVFLSANIGLPERYVSRHQPWGRLDYARRYGKTLDERCGLAIAWMFPMADFGPVIKQFAVAAPRQTAERLLLGRSFRKWPELKKAESAYPWGIPLDLTARSQTESTEPLWVPYWAKRGIRYEEVGPAVDRGFEDLEAIATTLKARQVGIRFIKPPFDRDFERFLAQAPAYQPLQAHLRKRAEALGPFVDPKPGWGGRRYFRDSNHLSLDGARALAALLGPQLRAWTHRAEALPSAKLQ